MIKHKRLFEKFPRLARHRSFGWGLPEKIAPDFVPGVSHH
jgi:hypothetical protein